MHNNENEINKNEIKTKICNCCLKDKELNEFFKHKGYEDGLQLRCKLCFKEIRIKTREKYSEYNKNYSKINKEKQLNYAKKYIKKRYKEDSAYRLKRITQSRIFRVLQRLKVTKSRGTIKLLGCSSKEYKIYIEKLFLPEMTWDNHGVIWEVDHIIACATFDLSIPEEQFKCFHYSNTQPLFKTTEIAKNFGYEDQIENRNKYNN